MCRLPNNINTRGLQRINTYTHTAGSSQRLAGHAKSRSACARTCKHMETLLKFQGGTQIAWCVEINPKMLAEEKAACWRETREPRLSMSTHFICLSRPAAAADLTCTSPLPSDPICHLSRALSSCLYWSKQDVCTMAECLGTLNVCVFKGVSPLCLFILMPDRSRKRIRMRLESAKWTCLQNKMRNKASCNRNESENADRDG